MSTVAEKKKSKTAMPPFAIEADSPKNSDLLIQALGNLRLRGSINAVKEVFDTKIPEDEGKKTRRVSARLIDGVPDTPGMQLWINPAELTWKSVDPLYKNEKLLDRIKLALSRSDGIRIGRNFEGVPPREERIDEDRMKTLCRELLCFIESGEAKVVKGMKPDQEDVDDLPGRYLLNASNMGNWHQPKYVDQYDAWVERVNQTAGG